MDGMFVSIVNVNVIGTCIQKFATLSPHVISNTGGPNVGNRFASNDIVVDGMMGIGSIGLLPVGLLSVGDARVSPLVLSF
eukprot:CAMPEP_0201574358 /NCGR_PEP_ID=MMETSP0190_2-20130828/18798_1 /ASSEMBLY_ACC=CAM_ASM_000263 /TAXON_ID=37353 /ORGANISM="Rosalina sp." /LENGTH=79 /DNA_ID=CAMNT_0048002495 /DNA_START=269 /DNA_END=505 /DNA_ORIENTATION=-